MNISQRFTFLVKGSLDAVLTRFEDPERSLHQLVLDMEDELESAKRSVAKAMANEDRLRTKIALREREITEWEEGAERALRKKDESAARDMLERLERSSRHRDRLEEERERQSAETEAIREAVSEMHEKLEKARARLELLQAQMRQGDARRSINRVMAGVSKANLQSEFDRLSERVELDLSAERSYQKLESELRGDDLKRKVEDDAVGESVEDRLREMKIRLDERSQSE